MEVQGRDWEWKAYCACHPASTIPSRGLICFFLCLFSPCNLDYLEANARHIISWINFTPMFCYTDTSDASESYSILLRDFLWTYLFISCGKKLRGRITPKGKCMFKFKTNLQGFFQGAVPEFRLLQICALIWRLSLNFSCSRTCVPLNQLILFFVVVVVFLKLLN